MVVKKACLLVLCGVLGVVFVLPATAGATVYCVDTTQGVLADNDSIDGSCEAPQATIASGLEEAAKHSGPDSVLIGPGSYTLPVAANGTEVTYSNSATLHLRGIGQPHLTMGGTQGMQSGLAISGGDGSTVEGFSLTIPANADSNGDWGLRLGAMGSGQLVARDLHVDGPAATNATAIILNQGAQLVDSIVALPPIASPSNSAVVASSGDAAILHDELTADVGVVGSGNTVTVERTQVTAWSGVQTDSGELVVRDSLIRVEKRSGAVGIRLANDNNSSSTILGTIENTTIVGGEDTTTAGIRVQANQTKETANATIADTVISGPTTAIQVWSDAERPATATVLYSNYDQTRVDINNNLDGSGASGTSTYLPTAVTDLAPGFVDPAGGDFGLAAGSALIDAGEPAAPAGGALDLVGKARAIAGTCGGSARRDIGAEEFEPTCTVQGPEGGSGPEAGAGAPAAEGSVAALTGGAARPQVPDTTILLRGKRPVTTSGKSAKVTVAIGSSVPGARYRCRIDAKAWRSCPAIAGFRLKPGKHKIAAVATNAAGTDPTPASMRVRVTRASDG